ncbi:biotin/lipoyl-containing protein [Flavobacterium sp.]|uniref:biotin/lipoyl-containing protein n=1 Tax=Flavobacterium sp. TaxID=239 RepID=UPI0008D56171|nr:biotin/lipoyl-containing protein [Flavobacterium sp.]OGS63493.1 MAG: hypothetical protein A2X07_03830 [Flavobacteria bacterium GWF1_32_7]HBD26587.1 hypothetical protein [Flavobacterium sp.]
MIKSLIDRIFNFKTKNEIIVKELKKNSSFKTKNEIESNQKDFMKVFSIEKGELKPVNLPDFGNFKGFSLSEWRKKDGEIVKVGDVICVVENENITMEIESIYSGKLIITSKIKQQLNVNSELFKVEGI